MGNCSETVKPHTASSSIGEASTVVTDNIDMPQAGVQLNWGRSSTKLTSTATSSLQGAGGAVESRQLMTVARTPHRATAANVSAIGYGTRSRNSFEIASTGAALDASGFGPTLNDQRSR
jgi:hypothetical protein